MDACTTSRGRSRRQLPDLVGGGGETVTLRLVARYADANNISFGTETFARKEAPAAALRGGRARPARDRAHDRDRRHLHPRRSRRGASAASGPRSRATGSSRPWENQPVGTPEDVAEMLAPFVALGYRHLVGGFPADYDEEFIYALRDRGEAAAREAGVSGPAGAGRGLAACSWGPKSGWTSSGSSNDGTLRHRMEIAGRWTDEEDLGGNVRLRAGGRELGARRDGGLRDLPGRGALEPLQLGRHQLAPVGVARRVARPVVRAGRGIVGPGSPLGHRPWRGRRNLAPMVGWIGLGGVGAGPGRSSRRVPRPVRS